MNYPNKIKKKNIVKPNTGNRGMELESIINQTNEYYLYEDIAVIHKKPVPITISKVDGTGQFKYISKAYFNAKSTTDYNGVYNGYYIDFDTKETKLKKYFPLSNIHSHQYEHLQRVHNAKGIAFIIVYFRAYDEIYLMFVKDFNEYVENNNSKNIPYTYFCQKGHLITYNYLKPLNYLEIVDKYIKNNFK